MTHRKKLPRRRKGRHFEAKLSGHKIHIGTGEYADGSLGEIFIDMNKAGSTMKGLMSGFAIAVSLGLQYGVPLERFVQNFKDMQFLPSGNVVGSEVKEATSILDLIFQILEANYLIRQK